MHECASATFDKLAGEEGFRQALEFVSNFQEDALGYMVALLRYYRPEFDGLPAEERLALIARGCGYTNDFLASLRKLTAFLEYGTPENDLRSMVEDADRDVKAAMLRDVEEISYAAIGEKLGNARAAICGKCTQPSRREHYRTLPPAGFAPIPGRSPRLRRRRQEVGGLKPVERVLGVVRGEGEPTWQG